MDHNVSHPVNTCTFVTDNGGYWIECSDPNCTVATVNGGY